MDKEFFPFSTKKLFFMARKLKYEIYRNLNIFIIYQVQAILFLRDLFLRDFHFNAIWQNAPFLFLRDSLYAIFSWENWQIISLLCEYRYK